jgi:serine/threonine protein kinase
MAVNSFTFTDNKLGPYLLLEMLDRGGMAVVYKAYDERSNKVVALKLLYPYLLTDPDSVKRFQREAKLITHFDHPNIVTLHEFGDIDGNFYLAMRYMSGGNLVRLFPQTRPFELDKSLKILKQIASALDYAHERNVVHRDLKLENVLLDDFGDCALGDFGIARVIDGTRYTQTGQVTGTPHYMSPEQAQGRSDIDYRADLYSLAVLVYRITTGVFPFTADDPLAVLNKHIGEIPPTPSVINPALPRELDYVLWKAMSKSPTDRFASAGDFVVAFERAFFTPIMTPRDLVSPEEDEAYKTRESMRTSVMEDAAVNNNNRNSNRRAILILLFALTTLLGTGFFAATRVLLPVLVMMGIVQPTLTPTEGGVAEFNEGSPSETNLMVFASATPEDDVTLSDATEELTVTSVPTMIIFMTNTPLPTFTRTPTPTRTNTPVMSVTPRLTSTTSSLTQTPVPPNSSTSTPVPPTSNVPTSVPPTSVAPTSVPPTSVPPTAVPPTPVPPTPIPPTPVPPTPVPPTPIPPTPLLPIIPTVIELLPTLVPILPPLFP